MIDLFITLTNIVRQILEFAHFIFAEFQRKAHFTFDLILSN